MITLQFKISEQNQTNKIKVGKEGGDKERGIEIGLENFSYSYVSLICL